MPQLSTRSPGHVQMAHRNTISQNLIGIGELYINDRSAGQAPWSERTSTRELRGRVSCDGVQYYQLHLVPKCFPPRYTLSSIPNRPQLLQHMSGEDSDDSERFLHDSVNHPVVLL
jgi:hypothetical protein